MSADDTLAKTADNSATEPAPVEEVADGTPTPESTPTPGKSTDSPWFWLGAMFLLSLVLRFMPVPNQAVATIGSVVAMVLHVVCVVNFAVQTTRLKLPASKLVKGLLLGGFLFGISWLIRPYLGLNLMNAGGPEVLSVWSIIGSFNYALRPLFLLTAAVCGGALVAQLINSRNMIGPVCGIIALIDVWGVLFGGIVSQLQDKAPALAKVAMSPVGAPGHTTAAVEKFFIPQLQIGVGDYLFLGLLFAALHRNDMDWRGAMRWVIPLIIAALLGVAFTGLFLPGLVFIGAGVAIPNWKYFEYTREEWFALLYSGIFVVILTVVLFFIIVSQLPEKPVPGNAREERAKLRKGAPPGNAPANSAPAFEAPGNRAPANAVSPQ